MGVKYTYLYVNEFYLNKPTENNKYNLISVNMMPLEFIAIYHLNRKTHNSFIFEYFMKDIYRMPHAGRVPYNCLVR